MLRRSGLQLAKLLPRLSTLNGLPIVDAAPKRLATGGEAVPVTPSAFRWSQSKLEPIDNSPLPQTDFESGLIKYGTLNLYTD